MNPMFHAISFFLVCVLAYYIAVVPERKEELSLEKHSEDAHSSQEDHSPTVEEEPADSPQDVTEAWYHGADEPAGSLQDVTKALDHGADEPEESLQDVTKALDHGADEPAESLQDVTKALDHGADEPAESLQDVTKALDHGADEPAEVPEAQEEETQQSHPLAQGWGEDIDWVETYEDGLKMAKTSQKPLMIIHHRENCPICKDLKAVFSGHEEIQRMAKEEFIMFNLMHETKDSNLAPDGYYVPRILFIDPTMLIRADISRNAEKYRFSYTDNDIQLLLENMKKAKILHNIPVL